MANDTPVKATTSLSNWQFWDQHVQNDMPGGNFINAATILIAAGPPRLSQAGVNTDASGDLAFPIGVVENFGLNQNKMIQKMFEIGSKRSYHIPGRTVGTFTLGRVLYWGPSLMRVLYAYYPSSKIPGGNALGNNNTATSSEKDLSNGSGPHGGATPKILDSPGYGNSPEKPGTVINENSDFFINLASDLFDHPLGLMVYLRDAEDEPYGAFYLEDCYLQAHSFNVNASSVLVAEGTSAQYDRLVPINITSAVAKGSPRRRATT